MMLITTVICIVHKKKSTNPKNGKTKCYHYPNGGSSFHTSATSLSVLWYLGLLFPQIVKEKKVLILAQNVVRKRCIWGLFSSCEKCSVLESYRSGFTPQLHDFPSMWPWWASCFILLLLEFPPLQNEYSHSILQNCCKLWDIYIKYLAWSFSISPSISPERIFRVDLFYCWLVWSPCCPMDSRKSSPAPAMYQIHTQWLLRCTWWKVHIYLKTQKLR